MTKEELIAKCRKLSSENEKLQDELNRLSDCYVEMKNQCADAINTLNNANTIKDIHWFIWKLQIDGLLTPQLKEFIEYYLKYHNERRG